MHKFISNGSAQTSLNYALVSPIVFWFFVKYYCKSMNCIFNIQTFKISIYSHCITLFPLDNLNVSGRFSGISNKYENFEQKNLYVFPLKQQNQIHQLFAKNKLVSEKNNFCILW